MSKTDGRYQGWRRLHHLALLVFHYASTRYFRRWSSRPAFERWQESKVLRHLEYVRENSSFYRKLWGNRSLNEWRQFPLIDKSMMMENFNSLNTVNIDRDKAMQLALEAEKTRNFSPQLNGITVGLSSGTSGNRGLFLVSEREQAAWAGTMLAKVLPRPLWKGDKIAFFLRANSNLYESVRSSKLQFRYFDLLKPIEKHVKLLNEYQPGILVATPSKLRLLAAQQAAGHLHITPHRILSVAEVLDPLDAASIEAGFNVPIHQVYQCTEGFLASTCRYGTLHLNEDIIHIEKEYMTHTEDLSSEEHQVQRRFVPIVTDFSRQSQPIIRYRLNDVLTESAKACPCGSVLTAIERIEGRCDDVFFVLALDSLDSLESSESSQLANSPQKQRLPQSSQVDTADVGEKLIAIYPDFITRAIISASPDIEEYRVIQHDSDQWEVQLKLVAEVSENSFKADLGGLAELAFEPQTLEPYKKHMQHGHLELEALVSEKIQELVHKLNARMPYLTFNPYTLELGERKLRRVERRWQVEFQTIRS